MKKLQLLSAAVLSVCAVSAFAETFLVTATVGSTCVFSAPTLAFGTYDPVDSEFTNGSTVLSAACTNGAAYNISLDAGQNAGTPGDVTTRNMLGETTSDLLAYNLYQDNMYSEEWGDTVGTNTVSGTGSGVDQPYTIYGQIAAGQTTVEDDSYSDTITVTATF